jgi:hypothetical protein
MKAMTNLNQNSESLDQDMNPRLPEQETGVLHTPQQCLVPQ